MSTHLTVPQGTPDVVEHAISTGASAEFVRTLLVSTDGRHHPRNVAKRAMRRDEPVSARAGDFITALADGDRGGAWARADLQNREILAAAGLADATLEP